MCDPELTPEEATDRYWSSLKIIRRALNMNMKGAEVPTSAREAILSEFDTNSHDVVQTYHEKNNIVPFRYTNFVVCTNIAKQIIRDHAEKNYNVDGVNQDYYRSLMRAGKPFRSVTTRPNISPCPTE